MSYAGKTIKHPVYGFGTVVRDNGGKIFVSFPEKEKYAGNQYCFNIPEAFDKGHISLVDGEAITDEVVKETKTGTKAANYYRDLYKKPFWDYLNEEKIKRTGEPYKMDTVAIDAFYLEKHSPDHDFLEWLRTDETMDAAKAELTRLIEEAGGPRVKARIDGYYSSLFKLREYLIQRGVI